MGTYWQDTGRFTHSRAALQALIPAYGDVKEQGRRLERFRRASNVYYDLYNNGLFNCFGEVRAVLGVTPRHYGLTSLWDIDLGPRDAAFRAAVEARMDEFILAAALEQGIDMVELSAHERLARAALHRRRRRR